MKLQRILLALSALALRMVRRLRGVEDYEVRDYELYTLKAIRAHSFRLRWRSTESLCRAYREWSTIEYCARWISLDASCIGRFTKWALTAPIDDEHAERQC